MKVEISDFPGYETALRGIGLVPTLEAHIGDYQGDWVVILTDPQNWNKRQIGVLVYGYGSCSGCDEWEDATELQERVDCLQSMVKNIKWFDTPKELKEWFLDEASALSWWSHEEDWPGFKEKVLAASDKELWEGSKESD